MPGDAYPEQQRPARRLPFPAPAFALIAAFALAAAACSGGAANTRPAGQPAAAALYEAGHAAMQQEDFATAAQQFRTLESLYPASPETLQGQAELIYAYYRQDDIAAVLVTSERLIRDQPGHPNLDYVYYLRGLAMFNQARAALAQDSVEIRPRPPAADLALEYFSALVARYPQSKYAEDARARIPLLQNGLANFELDTAKIYLNRGDYVNAGLHARAALENYPESSVKTEAAMVANMAYRMLDLHQGPPGGVAVAPTEDKQPDAGSTDAGPAVPAAASPDSAGPVADQQVTMDAPDPAAASAMPAESVDEAAGVQGEGSTVPAQAGLHGADWIARQDPGAYTLQLFSVADAEALQRFVRRHALPDLAWFETRRQGFPWFSLIHGVYPDAAGARAAAAELPAGLNLPQPWIRRMGEIQAFLPAASPQ
ncbi:MAG: outer membrane protein assembly factor BamD [Gammaproteobacteria bacterium]|nr:outer membrane protein assembly factor BamD [Gammaproteobacteria bacterium]